jgi:hypothetical protein
VSHKKAQELIATKRHKKRKIVNELKAPNSCAGEFGALPVEK